MGLLGDLIVRVGADIQGFQQAMGTVSQRLNAVNRDADKAFSGFDKLGSKLTDLGAGMTAALTVPLAGIGIAAYKAWETLDEAMDKIRTSTGATGEKLTGLGDSLKNVLGSVPSNAEQAATAIGDLSTRLGLSGKPLEDLAAQFLNLSRITKSELEPLITSGTRLFGDWSIATEKQASTLDYLFRVSQSTGIGMSGLMDIVVQFGAPLRALGFDLETAAAMMGKWQKEGVNVETVLSGLRFALGKFAAAGQEPAKAFEQVVNSIKNAKTESEATAIAFENFGKRAAVDMSRAIIEGRLNVEDLVASLKNSKETINDAAKDTADFAEQWVLFKNKLVVALEPLGNTLMQAMSSLLDVLSPVINALSEAGKWFGELPKPVQEIVVALGALVAVAGPTVLIAGQMVEAFASISKVIVALPGLFKLAADALAPVVTSIKGFIAGTEGAVTAAGALTVGLVALAAAFGAVALNIGGVADKMGAWLDKQGVNLWEILKGWATGADAATMGINSAAASVAKLNEVAPASQAALKQNADAMARLAEMAGLPAGPLGETEKAMGGAATAAVDLKKAMETLGLKDVKGELDAAEKALKDLSDAGKLNAGQMQLAASKIADLRWQLEAMNQGKTLQQLKKDFDDFLANEKKIRDYEKWWRDAAAGTNRAFNEIIAGLDKLDSRMREAFAEPTKDLQEFMGGMIASGNQAARAFDPYYAAIEQLGIKTQDAIQAAAQETGKLWETIANDPRAGQWEKDSAFLAMLKSWSEAARAAGQEIPASVSQMMAQLEAEVGSKSKGVTDAFGDMQKSIAKSITDLNTSMVQSLFEGDFSFGDKAIKMLKGIGEAVVTHFTAPATKAISDFVAGAISDLLGGKGFGGILDNLKGIGDALKGIFSGGASAAAGAAGNAAGAAGSAAGAAGNVAGGAGGAAGAATSGTLGAVLGIANLGVSIASGIVTGFQNAHMETSLNAIEHNTRYSMMYLGERGDGGILGILFKIDEELAWGHLTKATEAIRDALLGNITWLLDQIKGNTGYMLDAIGALSGALQSVASALGNINVNVPGAPAPVTPPETPPEIPPETLPSEPRGPGPTHGTPTPTTGVVQPAPEQRPAPRVRRFHSGGFVDSDMLAELRAGEFVLTPEETQTVFSFPKSSTTSFSGPIQIFVNGAQNPREVAREVMTELKTLSSRFAAYSQ